MIDDVTTYNARHIDVILVDSDQRICQIKRFIFRNSKLRRLSGRFQTLIWRPGDTVQNLESPGLSGRVDSPVSGVA